MFKQQNKAEYFKKILWNRKQHTKPLITHKALMKGRVLTSIWEKTFH